ncbi:hypothetical protein [Mangrovitalea sediminis]|uniref:hypothetical protein n=1 Tax=Mangrovitalea sediminis TaxID=1982043 RepID=UPI000BE5182A|nr:hypothetical protein [Mangrovitalea sediminis]
MRALARFIMRGPIQAAGVAVVAASLPLMSWVSAAAVSLVLLRVGLTQGLSAGLWALLPALGWLWLGDGPSTLVVIIDAMIMATVLRLSVSWEKTLLVGVVLGMISGLVIPALMPGLMTSLVEAGARFYQHLEPEVAKQLGDQLQPTVRSMLAASMGASYLVIAIASLALARIWQAQLYNPGGFRSEFHGFRLKGPVAVGILVAMFALPALGMNSVLVVMVLSIPLLLAGIALVHGLVSRKKLGVQWLVLFYVALVLLGPSLLLLLVVLAVIDSWLDIRSRVKPA